MSLCLEGNIDVECMYVPTWFQYAVHTAEKVRTVILGVNIKEPQL